MNPSTPFKLTKQRKMILDVLRRHSKLLSAQEIHALLIEAMPQLALSTIYRNIDALKRVKHIEEVFFNNDHVTRYQLVMRSHQHFMICTSCHQTIPLDFCHVKQDIATLLKDHGFTVTSHKLEFYGLCEHCSQV